MSQLLVSVIIPTYNRAHLLKRALDSALPQLIDGDEIIVIDDGSTDNTAEVMTAYGPPVRYIKIENGGAGPARNRGIDEAKGDLVAFLDSDDEWMAPKLALQRQVMAAMPDLLFCFSNFAIRTAEGKTTRSFLDQWHEDKRSWDEILGDKKMFSELGVLPTDFDDFAVYAGDMYKNEAAANYVGTFTLIVRRKAAGEIRYEPNVPLYEDWYYFARLAKAGKAAYIDIETAWQHGHAGVRLTDAGELVSIETRLKLLTDIWGSDISFLREHRPFFDEIVRQQQERQIIVLLKLGRTAEVRQILARIKNVSTKTKIVALLPSFLLKLMLKLKG
jgi:glycosyltransferase involved in cell wall biosynthesis